MAHRFAGILALLGAVVVLLRAIKNGAGFDGTILQMITSMLLLAAVGAVIGLIARATVDESTRNRIQAELDLLADAENSLSTNNP